MSQSYEKEFDALLEHLNATLGIPTLEKDDENSYTIASDELLITFINQEGTLIFLSNVGSLHEYNQQLAIKDYLLDANNLFYATNGGTFGISEEGIIAFCYQYPINALSKESFINKLDIFLTTLEAFIEQIKTIEHGIASSETNDVIFNTQQEGQLVSENWQKV